MSIWRALARGLYILRSGGSWILEDGEYSSIVGVWVS